VSEPSTVNSQITDAVSQVQGLISGLDDDAGKAIALQVLSHAVGLAIYNAVAQQQQLYTLRNAVTAAAVKAILASDPERALSFAEEALSDRDVVATLNGLREVMEDLSGAFTTGKPGGGETQPNDG
jgi:hypothetical protein